MFITTLLSVNHQTIIIVSLFDWVQLLVFQDRKKNPDAPLLFWTNGGPGGSAMDGAFGNYGPFDVTGKLKLKYSKWGWDKGQNVLFVDQPVGVGFSYSTDSRDKVRWGERVGEDMLAFFLQFMEAHPELRERELFLTGISYAGEPKLSFALYWNPKPPYSSVSHTVLHIENNTCFKQFCTMRYFKP